MTFAAEFERLADLLREAASKINSGIEAGFMGEETTHPSAKAMARVERKCWREAERLQRLANAGRVTKQQESASE